MDVDQSSQNEAMDGGGESKLKKGVLEDSGVTNQSMDVSSPAVQNRLSKNNNNGVSSKNNHTSAQNPAKNSVQNPTNPTQNTTAGQTLNNQSQQQQNSPLDSSGNPAQSNPPAAIILPDCCKPNLDILIVGINPGYHSAITKHHYAGPTNHFWKCLYDSKLVTELLSSEKDYRLPAEFGIGLTNLCTRVTTSSSELTGAELRAGARRLMRRLSEWKPKIIAFNGMTAWRAFARHALRLPAAFSDSTASVYGTQPTFLEGTVLYAMPSSSARCAHFPTAEDKLPHYLALKQLKDSIALAGGSPCGGGLPGANNDENLVQPRLSINGLGQSVGVSGVGDGSNVASNVASGLGNNSDKLVKGGITGPGTPNDIFKNMDNFGNTSTSNSAIAGTNGAQNIGLGNNMFSQNNMFNNNNSNTDALLQQLQTQAALNGLLSNNNQGLDITTLISLAMNGLQNQQSQQIQNQNNNIAAQLALINHNLTPNGMNFQNLDANTLSMLLGNGGGNGGNNNGIANQLGNSSLGNMNGGIGNMGNTGNNNSSDTMNQLLNAQHAQQQQAQLVQQLMAVQNSNSSAIDPAVTQLLQAQLLENQNSTGQNQQTYQNNNNGSNFQQLFTAQNQQVHRKTSNNQQVDAGQNDHLNFDFNNVTNFNQNSQNYNNMESNSMQQQLQQFNQLSNNNIGQFGNNNSTNVNNIKSENLAQQQATPAMHAVAMAHAHQQLQAQMNGGQSSGQMCQNPQGGQIRQNGSLGQMGQNGHSGQSGQFGQNLQGQNQLNPMNLNQNQSNLNLTGNFNAGNLSQKQLSNSQVNINNKSQINSSQTPQPQATLTQAQELARSNQKQNSADKKQQMLKRRRHSDTAMEREKEKRVYNWIQEQEFLKYPP